VKSAACEVDQCLLMISFCASRAYNKCRDYFVVRIRIKKVEPKDLAFNINEENVHNSLRSPYVLKQYQQEVILSES
jgi:hypothetical protein